MSDPTLTLLADRPYTPDMVRELAEAVLTLKRENRELRALIARFATPSGEGGPGVARFELGGVVHRVIVLRRPDGALESVEV